MIVLESPKMKFHAVSDGSFALDGGLMYGIVPKIFWQKWHEADAENCIRLGLWCLVVEHPDGLIVVDTGCGDKLNEKWRGIYDLKRPDGDLVAGMKADGLSPDDVTAVLLSHLHFDHCGGVTEAHADGSYKLAFPNAMVYASRTEYGEATNPNERTKGSYFRNTLAGYAPGSELTLLDGETEVLPGVTFIPTPGHTLGHQSILFSDAGESLVYWGDLIPMSTLRNPGYIAAIDNHPMTVLESKKLMLARAAEGRWHEFYCHNVGSPYAPPVGV